MARLEEKDQRFRHLEAKIGVVVFVALTGIIAVIVLLGMEKDIFTKKYYLYLVAESGSGFNEGMPVKLSGFKIGRVKRLELSEGAKVKVTLELNRRYQKYLREGTKGRLLKEGFIGEPTVEVTVGNMEARVLKDGEAIPYEKTAGIEELVAEAKPMLKEIKEIIHYVNDPNGDIKVMLGNIKGFTGGLRSTQVKVEGAVVEAGEMMKKMSGMVDNISKNSAPAVDSAVKILKNLENITLKLEPAMDRIDKITTNAETAAKNLPASAEKLEKIVDNVKGFTDVLSEEKPRIREILMDAGEAAHEGKAVIKGVKESWPVNLMIPPVKNPELVPLDGFVNDKGK